MLEVNEVKSAFRNLEIKDLITSKIMKLKAQFIYIKLPGSSQALQLHLAQLHDKSNLLVFLVKSLSVLEKGVRSKALAINLNYQPIFGSKRQIETKL